MTDQMQTDEILDRLRAANPASTSDIEATTAPAERQSARERAIRLGESSSRRGGLVGGRRIRTATKVGVAVAPPGGGVALLVIGVGSPRNPHQPEFAPP